jgi:hypothetical protein
LIEPDTTLELDPWPSVCLQTHRPTRRALPYHIILSTANVVAGGFCLPVRTAGSLVCTAGSLISTRLASPNKSPFQHSSHASVSTSVLQPSTFHKFHPWQITSHKGNLDPDNPTPRLSRSLPCREAALIHGVPSLRATLRGPPEIAASTRAACLYSQCRDLYTQCQDLYSNARISPHNAIASRSVLSTQTLATPFDLLAETSPCGRRTSSLRLTRFLARLPNYRQRYRAQKHANHSGLPTTPAAGRHSADNSATP